MLERRSFPEHKARKSDDFLTPLANKLGEFILNSLYFWAGLGRQSGHDASSLWTLSAHEKRPPRGELCIQPAHLAG